MAENTRPPVAIRIVRPYDTDDALLEHELETIGKTSVILIGAHPRPTGVILRFEVTLASGSTVLRGEGRVLAHKENAFRGQAGLTLRFTRLDPRSKSVVDRATAMREARAQGERSSPSHPPPPRADAAIADALTASTPEPSAAAPIPAAPTTAPLDVGRSEAGGSGGLLATQAEQEAAVASARAAAREKANATARTNAKRTALRGAGLTPPPVPTESRPPPVPTESRPPPTAPEATASHDDGTAPSHDEAARPSHDEAITASHDEATAASHDRASDDAADAATPEPTPVTSIPGLVAEKPAHEPPGTGRPPARSERPEAPTERTGRRRAPSAGLSSPREIAVARPPSGTGPLAPPADRAGLLERLRSRATTLGPERVAEILAARPPRA